MEPEALSRRERQKRATRQKLYECAVSLFLERSYEQTTIDDIAAAADVARATVFNYYGRKEDFLLAWSEGRRQRIRDLLEVEAATSTQTEILVERTIAALAQINQHERAMTVRLLPAWVRTGAPVTEQPYFALLFAELVSRGQRLGDVKQDVNSLAVGHMLRHIYLGVLFRWVADGSATPPFDLSRALGYDFRLLFSCLLTAEHTAEISQARPSTT